MLPITPAGKYTTPSRLRWPLASLSRRSRDPDAAKAASQCSAGSNELTSMPSADLWLRHLHRLEELEHDERRAVRMSIVIAAGVFVTLGGLLAVVQLFGLPPATQYAMVHLF